MPRGRANFYIRSDEIAGIVTRLARVGTPHKKIAAFIGCSPRTMYKHYREELDNALVDANAAVAQSLFEKATHPGLSAPSVTAAIFWLKCQGRWAEPKAPEADDDDGKAVSEIEWTVVDDAPHLTVVK